MSVSTRASAGRRHDHGFHPLRIRRVVAETRDAVSLVLDVPAELARRIRLSRRAVPDVPAAHRRPPAPALVLDVLLPRGRRRAAGHREAGAPAGWSRTGSPARWPQGDTLESTCPAGVFCLGAGYRRHRGLRRWQRHHAGLLAAEDRAGDHLPAGPAAVREPRPRKHHLPRRARRARRALPRAGFEVVHHFDVDERIRRGRRRSGRHVSGGPRDRGLHLRAGAVHGSRRGDPQSRGVGAERIHIERFTRGGARGRGLEGRSRQIAGEEPHPQHAGDDRTRRQDLQRPRTGRVRRSCRPPDRWA